MADLEEITERVKRDYNASLVQREQADEDHRFISEPEGMWGGWFDDQFCNRPRLTFDIISESVNRAIGEWRTNRFRTKFVPRSDTATEQNAKILGGLYRRDFVHNGGQCSVDNAVDELYKVGVGHFRLVTAFVNEDDPEDESQQIDFKQIPSSYNTVIWDANAKEINKSDAEWCTVLTEYTNEAFEREFPGFQPSSIFQPFETNHHNTFVSPYSGATVRNSHERNFVAEHYEVIKVKRKVVVFQSETTGEIRRLWEDDIEDLFKEVEELGLKKVREYQKTKRSIKKTITNGQEELKPSQALAGKFIPIIPMYGYRAEIGDQEYYYGLVRNYKDANRLVNMSISQMAEHSALSVREVPIFSPQQVLGYENLWAEAHQGNHAYMVLNPDIDPTTGNPLPAQFNYLKPAQTDPNTVNVFEAAAGFIRQQTGANTEEMLDTNATGPALNAVQRRVDMPIAVYTSNIEKSLTWAGRVYHSMASDIYDATVFAQLKEEDGTDFSAMLNEWAIGEDGEPTHLNDISKGEFNVEITTGASFSSERRETSQRISDIMAGMSSDSPYMGVLMSTLIENVAGSAGGMEDLKKFNRKFQVSNGFKDPETDEEKQLVAQLQQQAQQQSAQDQFLQAEAQRAASEAQENQSQVDENISKAALNRANAAKIVNEIQVENFNTSQDALEKRMRLMIDLNQVQQQPLPRLGV